jgi:hypothetical protein
MIYLNQGQLNQPATVCSRNATLNNPYYLWSATHLLSRQTWNFIPFRIPPATVGYSPGYDLFCFSIDENSPQVFTGSCGVVNVHLLPGQYELQVWEQTSNTNLHLSAATNIVQTNMLTVVGVNKNIPITYSGGGGDTYIIYNADND